MLLIQNNSSTHVSIDAVKEFETILLQESVMQVAGAFPISLFIYRLCRKLGFSTIRKTVARYAKKPLKDKKHLFMVMMGLDVYGYRPYGLFTNHNRSIYLFDAWEKDHEKITTFVRDFGIDYVFVSSSQAAERLNRLLGQSKFYWIPEGINPSEYKYVSFEKKDIDVLALGRRYDDYHHAIVSFMEKNHYVYLYEKEKGNIIFPTRDEFIDGLARTKISICVPSNITHPDRAGDIETMTIRYLQSMISKCLIVGRAPKEMIELFGYNPVIEIDETRLSEQLNDILKNYADYVSLIEKNYRQVIQHHTWKNRWQQIKDIYTLKT